MNKLKFGIISGAGPMAGVSLCRQIFELFQKQGCWKDADFPPIHMMNYPFSEMLEKGFDKSVVEAQLRYCLIRLQQECEFIVIACNTLHLFLPEAKVPQLVNLIELVKEHIPKDTKPLVIASRTTAEEDLYQKLLGIKCDYFNPEKSQAVINDILKGKSVDLGFIEQLAKKRTVILGCTEYSLAMEGSPPIKNLIDPLKIAAQTFFELFKRPKKDDR